ncbi:hypothetical protein ABZ990_26395 [Streptomyces sp. NPDC046203]|uniref:hypothetical protein n=1 Tax=Streptomyces sp. NPDC046203 TaxID=3154602 RepID=UPI0033CAFF24
MFRDDEPVFKRKYGKYYFNPRNPTGFALIIGSLLFAGVMLLLMKAHAGPFAGPDEPTTRPSSTWTGWYPPADDPAQPFTEPPAPDPTATP